MIFFFWKKEDWMVKKKNLNSKGPLLWPFLILFQHSPGWHQGSLSVVTNGAEQNPQHTISLSTLLKYEHQANGTRGKGFWCDLLIVSVIHLWLSLLCSIFTSSCIVLSLPLANVDLSAFFLWLVGNILGTLWCWSAKKLGSASAPVPDDSEFLPAPFCWLIEAADLRLFVCHWCCSGNRHRQPMSEKEQQVCTSDTMEREELAFSPDRVLFFFFFFVVHVLEGPCHFRIASLFGEKWCIYLFQTCRSTNLTVLYCRCWRKISHSYNNKAFVAQI